MLNASPCSKDSESQPSYFPRIGRRIALARGKVGRSPVVNLSLSRTDHIPSVITWLLHHDPAERPTAVELSKSNLLPPRLEDEYFKDALQMMGASSSKFTFTDYF